MTQTKDLPEEFYRPHEVREMLNISDSTLLRLRKKGVLDCRKLVPEGRAVGITKKSFLAYQQRMEKVI